MKVFIILALAAGASAGVVENTVAESGVSTQHRTQDVLGNYNFGYDEKHTSGGSWRKESGDANGNTVGSYGLTDADGRVRVVHYVADIHGFRASVATNEPGTAPSSPSGVGINAPMGPTGPHGDVTLDGVSLSAAPVDVAAAPAESLADASPVAVPAPVTYAAAPIPRVAVAAPQVTYRAPEVTYAASQLNYATAPVARVAVAAPQVTYNAPQIVYAAAAPRITYAAAPVTRLAYASAPYGRVAYGGPFRVSSVGHQIAAAAAPVSYTAVAPAAVKFANFGPAQVATHAAATPVATYAVPAPVFRRVVPIEFVGAGQAYLGGHGKYGR
ncbi:calphotin-like [Ixodes scapularis]|uniref:calphotin-like n=1 Tax=Ixodes scapularis TaxID=6945 RepID=UPI001C38F05D|nr:calphotin-like [Ixodes scapularis]